MHSIRIFHALAMKWLKHLVCPLYVFTKFLLIIFARDAYIYLVFGVQIHHWNKQLRQS